jgi:hypothetical protein
MKKQLLLFLSFLMISAFTTLKAQTGSVTIVSIQSSIEAGTNGAIEVTYTSDVACKLNIQLRETNPNETKVNFNKWIGQMNVADLAVAATPTTVTLNYSVSGSQIPSADLATGVQYTFSFKLVGDNSEGDFGYNDGETANITTITAPTSVVNSVSFTSVPTEISAGSDMTANFKYTLVNEGKVKVDIRKYDGETWLSEGLVVETFINPAAATSATAVAETKMLTIGNDTPLSSSLTGNENYKTVVTLYDDSWTFIMQTKSDLTITASLGTDDNDLESFSLYPNPVDNVLHIKSNQLEVKTIRIFDITGRTVKAIDNAKGVKSVDTSSLKRGIYIMSINNNLQYKFVKK